MENFKKINHWFTLNQQTQKHVKEQKANNLIETQNMYKDKKLTRTQIKLLQRDGKLLQRDQNKYNEKQNYGQLPQRDHKVMQNKYKERQHLVSCSYVGMLRGLSHVLLCPGSHCVIICPWQGDCFFHAVCLNAV